MKRTRWRNSVVVGAAAHRAQARQDADLADHLDLEVFDLEHLEPDAARPESLQHRLSPFDLAPDGMGSEILIVELPETFRIVGQERVTDGMKSVQQAFAVGLRQRYTSGGHAFNLRMFFHDSILRRRRAPCIQGPSCGE